MIQFTEFNRFQILAIIRDCGETLVSLGQSEIEARWYCTQQAEELGTRNVLCYVLREWQPLPRGGYWKTLTTWRPKERKSHALTASERSADTRRRAWSDAGRVASLS